MHKYIGKRLLYMIPVLLGVTFIIFALMYFTPGDPARMMLGDGAPQEQVEQKREELGLNDPFLVQYGRYMKNLIVHQDVGRSFRTQRPVVDEIMERFPATLQLAAAGTLISIIIGVPTGVIAATKQYSIFDNISMFLALLGLSMPLFWLAMMLVLVFSVNLGWLPASGFGTFDSMILPAFSIGVGSAATIARMTRSSMLEVIRQDYIRTARAKGQKESVVIIRHALKNALIPIITVIGLQFGFLLGGAVLTESIFAIPGVGRLMVDAIGARDFPVVQGGVLFIAVTFSLINLLVDILYGFVDPRVKSQYR